MLFSQHCGLSKLNSVCLTSRSTFFPGEPWHRTVRMSDRIERAERLPE